MSTDPDPVDSRCDRHVLLTRPTGRGNGLARLLESRGVTVIHAPLFRVDPIADLAHLDRALDGVARYAWVVVTSVNAASVLRTRHAGRLSSTAPIDGHSVNVCAVGPATAQELRDGGITVGAVPDDHRASALLADLLARGVGPGDRVLFVRGERTMDVVPDGLRAAGVEVDDVIVYRTVALPLDPPGGASVTSRLRAGSIDAVVLASGETARQFARALREAAVDVHAIALTVVCIGPVTAAEAAAAGLPVMATAAAPDDAAIARALAGALATRRPGRR